MSDLLAAVVAASRRASDEREREKRIEEVEQEVARRPKPGGDRFRASLAGPGIRIIAECKRRSPSKGVLREQYDPVAIAASYQAAGAAAISVLTEPTFFDGSLDHLRRVRQAVDLPLLRKDFVVTPYQVVEAAAAGADAVLFIVAALDDGALGALMARADAVGLAALVEVHDAVELDRALQAGATLIGVNSRNLKTLAIDQRVLDALGPSMPAGTVAVAESGLKTAEDLVRLRLAGYQAFLMGERFMVEGDPGSALESIRRAAAGAGTV